MRRSVSTLAMLALALVAAMLAGSPPAAAGRDDPPGQARRSTPVVDGCPPSDASSSPRASTDERGRCCAANGRSGHRYDRGRNRGVPVCPSTGSADEHRSATWDDAARIRSTRRLLAELEANPPTPTAGPTDPGSSTCPTFSEVPEDYEPAASEMVFTNLDGSPSFWLVSATGAWDESTCPTFTSDTLSSLAFVASPYATFGPATAARLSWTWSGESDVWYYQPDYTDDGIGVPGSEVTGGAIAPYDQFFLEEKWCRFCTFTGTVYDDEDISDGAIAIDAQFASVHFTDVDLDGANLTGTQFTATDEAPASLRGVSLRGAKLDDAVFDMNGDDAVLTDMDFTGADMGCVQFRDLVLGAGVTFDGATWGTGCPNPQFSNVVMEIETLATIGSSDVLIDASSIHVGSAASRAALKNTSGDTDLGWLRLTSSRFIGLTPDLGATFDENGQIDSRVSLASSVLDGSRFSSADLTGAVLSGASMTGTLFSSAELWQADLTAASAASADFSTAQVWDATFTGATLTGASFAGADAHGAAFDAVTAARVDFAGAYLFPGGAEGVTPVTFAGSNVTDANFSGALLGATLFDDPATLLAGASFAGAQCISCNFTNAALVSGDQGVDFQRSYLNGATFSTSLDLANFTDATCCATIPPDQTSLVWEFSDYVPKGQGIAGADVPYDGSDLTMAVVEGATCPDGSLAGPSGCTGSQITPRDPGRLGCVSAYVYTCQPTITTRAGNGVEGFDPTNEFALTSPLGDPASVVVVGADVLFADPANHVVREVTNVNSPDPTIVTIAGTGAAGSGGDGGPASKATLSAPSGLAVRDSDGALAIADRDADVVRLIAANGAISTIAGDGTACADPTSRCGDGGPATSAQLNGPTTVWFAPNDDLYIADTDDHRVRVVDGDTGLISTAAGDGTVCPTTATDGSTCGDGGPAAEAQLSSPTGGLVGDQQGNLYVSDTGTARVRIVDPAGEIQQYTAEGALQAPTGLAIDAVGNRYIADRSAHAIYRINAAGIPIPRPWAGTAGTACADPAASSDPCGDGGLAADATFDSPTGMFIAPGAPLSLWIADTDDQRIRHVIAPF